MADEVSYRLKEVFVMSVSALYCSGHHSAHHHFSLSKKSHNTQPSRLTNIIALKGSRPQRVSPQAKVMGATVHLCFLSEENGLEKCQMLVASSHSKGYEFAVSGKRDATDQSFLVTIV